MLKLNLILLNNIAHLDYLLNDYKISSVEMIKSKSLMYFC